MATEKKRSVEPGDAPARQALLPVMPFINIREPEEALEFYRDVFGAEVLMRDAEPGDLISHIQFRIGDSLFMISNPASRHLAAFAEAGWARTARELGGTPVHLYVQIADVDAAFAKALAAGAKVVHPVADMEWGDRTGGFQDPWGHIWYVATPLSALRKK
jgi:PhnB protein